MKKFPFFISFDSNNITDHLLNKIEAKAKSFTGMQFSPCDAVKAIEYLPLVLRSDANAVVFYGSNEIGSIDVGIALDQRAAWIFQRIVDETGGVTGNETFFRLTLELRVFDK